MTRWHAHGAATVAAGLSVASEPAIPEGVRAQIAGEEAHLAWELARLAHASDPAEHLALAAIALLTQDALARGSTRVPWSAAWLVDQARTIGFEAPVLDAIARVHAAPTPVLFGAPADRRPLVIDGAHLYQERLFTLEVRLAARLAERIARPIDAPREIAIDAPVPLTDEQRTAVREALRSPLTVVSGGPGTGKTSIVVAILRAAIASGVVDAESAIALAAPTGKAADRMRRSIGGGAFPSPTTLHRLLGYSPARGGFRHGAHNPLAQRLVIVDESSMIDVFLMERLASALRPDARLVLLGDAEQLPSVAAGAVFRDLGRAKGVRSVVLTKSHRMDPKRPEGLAIGTVAAAVNRGEVPEIDAIDLRALDSFSGVARFDPGGAGGRERFVDAWLEQVRPGEGVIWPVTDGRVEGDLEPLFAALERVRLLCVTRSGARPTGADAINAALHRRLADARGTSASRLLAGEPVLVHTNDYERGIFNGDQGLVLTTIAPGESARPSAVFRRDAGFVAFPLESVRASIELGYATTVHKAQGSEHDRVALVLPETDTPHLLTREIIYTAITRARRAVLIVGQSDLLARAAQRRIERETGIADRLSEV